MAYVSFPPLVTWKPAGGRIIVVHPLNRVWLFETPLTGAHHAPLSSTIFWSLLRFMFIELVMPSNHLILCCPLLLLPSVFVSIRVFFELTVHINCWSIGASASASALSVNIQGWFPLGLAGLFSCRLSNSEESSAAPPSCQLLVVWVLCQVFGKIDLSRSWPTASWMALVLCPFLHKSSEVLVVSWDISVCCHSGQGGGGREQII